MDVTQTKREYKSRESTLPKKKKKSSRCLLKNGLRISGGDEEKEDWALRNNCCLSCFWPCLCFSLLLWPRHERAHTDTTYLEQSFEHDVYDLVLLIDVVQLHQILERVQLIFPLGLKQPLVWWKRRSGARALNCHPGQNTHSRTHHFLLFIYIFVVKCIHEHARALPPEHLTAALQKDTDF